MPDFSTPLRVLFVCCDPPESAIYRYRCGHLSDVLNSRSGRFLAETVYVGDNRIRVAHDVVVLHRICDVSEGRAFERAARRIGAILIYSTDDLVWDSTIFDTANPRASRLARFAPLHFAMMKRSDRILVSTEFLAGQVKSVLPGTLCSVVRNFLNADMLSTTPSRTDAKTEQVILGYLSGSATHDDDLASIAGPISRVLRAYPSARLRLVGPVTVPTALTAFEAQIERRGFVPWRELPTLLAQIDINLAPLVLSSPMNHAKSEIKALEAAVIGVPTIASATAGFREASDRGLAVTLAKSEADWENAIVALVDNREARAALGNAANRSLESCGTFRAEAESVVAAFAAAEPLSRARGSEMVHFPFAPKYALKRMLAGILNR